MKTEPATTKYKRCNAVFKHSAVEHWLLSGKSARIIAGELGLNEQSLHKWKQPFKALPAGSGGRHARSAPGQEPASAKGAAPAGAAAGHSKKTLGIISEVPGSGSTG
jgi:transposase-like protein